MKRSGMEVEWDQKGGKWKLNHSKKVGNEKVGNGNGSREKVGNSHHSRPKRSGIANYVCKGGKAGRTVCKAGSERNIAADQSIFIFSPAARFPIYS